MKNEMNKTSQKKRAKSAPKFLACERGEFGMNAIIGIAIGLIVAAFILIPGIQNFATQIMTDMQNWWTNAISSKVFIR
ncbi:hypothetical protein ACR6HW_10715 [Fusibacter sp. JL298sf-3]